MSRECVTAVPCREAQEPNVTQRARPNMAQSPLVVQEECLLESPFIHSNGLDSFARTREKSPKVKPWQASKEKNTSEPEPSEPLCFTAEFSQSGAKSLFSCLISPLADRSFRHFCRCQHGGGGDGHPSQPVAASGSDRTRVRSLMGDHD